MSYRGYVLFMTNYCVKFYNQHKRKPSVLEVGVDTGITAMALHNNLNTLGVPVSYTGVDVVIKEYLKEYFHPSHMIVQNKDTIIQFIQGNSLEVLPWLIERKKKYDLIMIDGDHNYKTVSQECNYIESLMHKDTLFVFDDYTGRYENTDMFYSERDQYKDLGLLERKNDDSEKKGVRPAVDEFQNRNSFNQWKLYANEPPVCLFSKDNSIIRYKEERNESKQ